MSVSAGLAHEGFRPLAFAFAPFASMRCYEQVRTDICYSKLPVVIIGNGEAIPTALPAARTARWRTPRSWSPATT